VSTEDEQGDQVQIAKHPAKQLDSSAVQGDFENANGKLLTENEAGTRLHGRLTDGVPSSLQALAIERRMSVSLRSHKGPLPAPEQFREYEAIYPGAAHRIIRMAEDEGEHRRNRETEMIGAAIATERRSQYLGFLVYVLSLGAGSVLLYAKVPVAGIVTILTTLATMLGSAVWNKVEERKLRQLEERAQKALEERAQKDARGHQESKGPKKNNRKRR
jgi:uncharacterized membrane protein